MYKVETILLGIALILFGIASMLIAEYTRFRFFEFFAVVAPILGLIISVIGVFYEGKTKNDSEKK